MTPSNSRAFRLPGMLAAPPITRFRKTRPALRPTRWNPAVAAPSGKPAAEEMSGGPCRGLRAALPQSYFPFPRPGTPAQVSTPTRGQGRQELRLAVAAQPGRLLGRAEDAGTELGAGVAPSRAQAHRTPRFSERPRGPATPAR